MPEPYSWDIREAAEEQYIIDGRTYEQVADATGVSLSQLKRWGLDSVPTWTERRREYRQAQTSVRRGVMLAKARLIESVIETEDAQKAYAFSALVSSGKVLDQEARERIPVSTPERGTGEPIEMPDDIATVMVQRIQKEIWTMLSAPGSLNITAIDKLKSSLRDLLARPVTAKEGGAAADQSQAMTPEELQAVIKKVYGS